jgi:hypothetical protein
MPVSPTSTRLPVRLTLVSNFIIPSSYCCATTLDYANEQYVGAAIRESGLAREDLWITTKYDGGDVLEEAHTSLRKVRPT